MNRSIAFEDLPNSVGTVIEAETFAITARERDHFVKGTWLDRAYPEDAAEFPETLVEGFLVLAMLDAVVQLTGAVDAETMWGLNYGLDRVRFVAPVHLDQCLKPRYEIAAVEEKDKGFKVLYDCTFTIEETGQIALTAQWWSLVMPKGTVERARRDG